MPTSQFHHPLPACLLLSTSCSPLPSTLLSHYPHLHPPSRRQSGEASLGHLIFYVCASLSLSSTWTWKSLFAFGVSCVYNCSLANYLTSTQTKHFHILFFVYLLSSAVFIFIYKLVYLYVQLEFKITDQYSFHICSHLSFLLILRLSGILIRERLGITSHI